jgi:hypothetical protein
MSCLWFNQDIYLYAVLSLYLSAMKRCSKANQVTKRLTFPRLLKIYVIVNNLFTEHIMCYS